MMLLIRGYAWWLTLTLISLKFNWPNCQLYHGYMVRSISVWLHFLWMCLQRRNGFDFANTILGLPAISILSLEIEVIIRAGWFLLRLAHCKWFQNLNTASSWKIFTSAEVKLRVNISLFVKAEPIQCFFEREETCLQPNYGNVLQQHHISLFICVSRKINFQCLTKRHSQVWHLCATLFLYWLKCQKDSASRK